MNLLRTVVLSVSLFVFFTDAVWKYWEAPWKYNFKPKKHVIPMNESVDIESRCLEVVNVTNPYLTGVPYDPIGVLSPGGDGNEELCRTPAKRNDSEGNEVNVQELNGMKGKFCLQRGNSSRKYYYGSCEKMPTPEKSWKNGSCEEMPTREKSWKNGSCEEIPPWEKSWKNVWREGVDLRIPCRKAGDRMLWYRGKQSVSGSGKKCLYWTDVRNVTDYENFHFNTIFSPSLVGRFGSNDLHNHENFCRNPTRSKEGPWCFVTSEETMEPVAEMCFEKCVRNLADQRMCLGKMLFPYSNSIVNPDDLSDLLDVEKSYNSADRSALEGVPLYSFGARSSQRKWNMRTSRNQCFLGKGNTGREAWRTALAGPWKLVASYSYRETQFGERPPGLFQPCFYACEDVNVECSPESSFPYFGLKDEAADERKCLTYKRAAEIILNGPPHTPQNTFYAALFSNSTLDVIFADGNTTSLDNTFYVADPKDFVSNKCLNIGWMLFGFNDVPEMADHYNLFSGPGCFVQTTESGKTSAVFVPCFNRCNDTDLDEAPRYRRGISDAEREKFSSEMNGTKKKFIVSSKEFEGFVNHVNPVSIVLVASVGTFSLFAVLICILIWLNMI